MSEHRTEDAALAVVDQLNTEKKSWSFEVVSHVVLDREVVVLGRLTVDGVTKMAFGSMAAPKDDKGNHESVGLTLKAAANEALARAARLFGVGLVFEGPAGDPTRGRREDAASRAMAAPENRVTQKQLGAIHGFARRRNIGRAELGALLHERFEKTELVSLTKKEASALIDELAQANGHAGA